MSAVCPLCASDGGVLLWSSERLRVVRVDDAPEFPAFYRVIWNAHVAEFSDLDAADRAHCMEAVATVERVLRQQLAPTKINLASLGNVVPHLHWHVVARFEWDSRFPQPLWAPPVRELDAARRNEVVVRIPSVDAALKSAT